MRKISKTFLSALMRGAGSTSVFAIAVATGGGVANAQVADGAAAASAEADGDRDAAGVIIVTAQRREESAQDVPISIQAFSGEQLVQMGVSDTNDLPLAVPGFQISSSAQNQLYYLRGVGSQQVGVGRPPEVATVIDGVYMPFASAALQGFSNLASIEVDKGPQGTLFGRNTTGGVVQINTLDPTFDLSGEVQLGYGNYNHLVAKGHVSAGLTSNIAASLALVVDDQMDGFGKSVASGLDVYKTSIYSGQAKLLFQLSDATELRLSGMYARVKGDNGSAISPADGVQLWNQVTQSQMNLGFYDTAQNAPTFHRTKSFMTSAKLNHDFGWANFLSVTAYQGYNTDHYIDFDAAPQVFLPIEVISEERALTQELQLSSPNGSSIIWTVGAFYLDQNGSTQPFAFGSPFASIVFPFGVPLGDRYEIRSETKISSIAGYGQVTVPILPSTNVTLGLRYTMDKIRISGFGQVAGPSTPTPRILPPTVGTQEISRKEPTYRIGFDHSFSPNLMVYASYNRGFQSGGFNASNAGGFSPAANPPLDPEFIDAYEVGFKSDLFDRQVRFNVAAFWYDYQNLQQQTYVGGTLQTLNAGAARIKGVDFELAYNPSSNLALGLVGEVLDAKFTEFLNAPGYRYRFGTYGLGPLDPVPVPDAAGNYLAFAPKYSAAAYVNHTLETGVGMFKTSVNVSYNDGYFIEPSNLFREEAFTVVNASEEWRPNEAFSIRLWVKNLFNVVYDQSVAAVGTVGFTGNTPGAPREYGASIGYRF